MSVQQCGGSGGICPCRRTRRELDDAKDNRVKEAMRSNDNDAVPRGGGGGPGIVAPSELPKLFPKHFLHLVHLDNDEMWVCSECGHGIGVHPDAARHSVGDCEYEKQRKDDGELVRVQKLLEGEDISKMIIAEVVGERLTQGINNIAQLTLMCRGREQRIHSSSRRRAAVDADCLINGPWMGVNYLRIASLRDGTPIIAKFFRTGHELSTMEAIHPVISLLVDAGLQFAGFNLHAPSGEVATHGYGKADARKGVATMEMYAYSLSNGPPFTPEVIADRVLLLVTAVEELHEHGWAHLDVKEGNVFVSHTGSWLLGDFDACRKLNDPIDITTESCFTEEAGDIFGEPAEPIYDFEMLAGLVATQFTRFKSEEVIYVDESGCVAQPGGQRRVRMSKKWRDSQLRRFAASCDAAATLLACFEKKLHDFEVSPASQ